MWMWKSPSITRGVLSSGKFESSISNSSKKKKMDFKRGGNSD